MTMTGSLPLSRRPERVPEDRHRYADIHERRCPGPALYQDHIRSAPVMEPGWSEVAKLASLPLKQTDKHQISGPGQDAFIRGTVIQSVWVIRHSETELSVYSPVCTHLGCYFAWNQTAERFECPCHASVFSADGKVLGGPAPRPLDTLPYKVENGTVSVKWEHFKSGVPEKVQV